MGDCNFSLTFAVVDYFCHDLLLGTSFIHESRSNLLFDKPTPMLKVNDGRVSLTMVRTAASNSGSRNRRAEAFEVGGHCRIRKKGPTARTRGGLQPWSTDLWRVERITDHVVTVRSVESSGVHLDVGRDDVLPVIAPSTAGTPEEAATPFEGDPVGGPSACGE